MAGEIFQSGDYRYLLFIICNDTFSHMQEQEETFADEANCSTTLEMKYHNDILKLRLAFLMLFLNFHILLIGVREVDLTKEYLHILILILYHQTMSR